jgi:hypothetical protein
MTAFLIILGIVILAHAVIVIRHGIGGVPVTYLLATIVWVFYPGYDSGFASWIATNLAVLGLVAIGSFFPSGPTSIVVAGVGGFLLGEWMAEQ